MLMPGTSLRRWIATALRNGRAGLHHAAMPLTLIAKLSRSSARETWTVAYDPEGTEFVLVQEKRIGPSDTWRSAVHPLRAHRGRLLYDEARVIVDGLIMRGVGRAT
jgi:hypothetical protein